MRLAWPVDDSSASAIAVLELTTAGPPSAGRIRNALRGGVKRWQRRNRKRSPGATWGWSTGAALGRVGDQPQQPGSKVRPQPRRDDVADWRKWRTNCRACVDASAARGGQPWTAQAVAVVMGSMATTREINGFAAEVFLTTVRILLPACGSVIPFPGVEAGMTLGPRGG
jgi:hypothetical protein